MLYLYDNSREEFLVLPFLCPIDYASGRLLPPRTCTSVVRTVYQYKGFPGGISFTKLAAFNVRAVHLPLVAG